MIGLAGKTTSWMSSAEIATRTGLSPRYIRLEIQEGKLPAFKFGNRGGRGTYRIPAAVGEAYIKRMMGALYRPANAAGFIILFALSVFI